LTTLTTFTKPKDIANMTKQDERDHREREAEPEPAREVGGADRGVSTGVTTKRFFDLDDGYVDYTVVARDLEHAEQIMRDAGIEFLDPSVSYDEAKASGAFDWSEMPNEQVARTKVHRCEAGRPDPVPLADCDIGDWFCSEW